MSSKLPLNVLGQVGPILGWVEGAEGLGLPERWLGGRLSVDRRERAWLERELPTYSYDTVREIVTSARAELRATRIRGGEWSAPEAPSEPRSEAIPAEFPGRVRRYIEARDRERAVFSRITAPSGYSLGDAFRVLGDRYFEWRGSELRVRRGRLEELHELSTRFPVSHLIAHRYARAMANGRLSERRALDLPNRLGLLHTSRHGLHALVRRGVSEGHLHLWGVLHGADTWADHLLRRQPERRLAGFPPEELRLLALGRSAARLLAFAALSNQARVPPPRIVPRASRSGPGSGRSRSGAHPAASEETPDLLGLLDGLYFASHPYQERAFRQQLEEALWQVEHVPGHCYPGGDGVDGETSEEDRLRWIRESSPGELWSCSTALEAAEWHSVGPLLRVCHPLLHRLLDERWPKHRREAEGIRSRIRTLDHLHLAVHRQLLEPPRPFRSEFLRSFLHDVFFRYLVFSTHHLQLAAQHGRTTGLRYFKRFMDSRQRSTMGEERDAQGLILERLRRAGPLHTVEGRVSPPRRPEDVLPWVLGYAEAVQGGDLESFGLVAHFIKGDEEELEDPASPAADARAYRSPRFGKIRRLTKERAGCLYRLLSQSHPLVPFIVGIDAANLELTTPPEVFAPAFRFLREKPIEARAPTSPWARFGAHWEVISLLRERRLGLTYHVGEDFRHLLSGLRAIHEVIHFLKPRPGDRLGHAIALALEPRVWLEQTGYQAVMPKLEALDTLVWVYHFLGASHPACGELEIENLIQQLSREVYGVAPSPEGERFAELSHIQEEMRRGQEELRRRQEELSRRREQGDDPFGWESLRPRPARAGGTRSLAEPTVDLERHWSSLTLQHAWLLRQLDPFTLDLRSALHGRARLRDLPANSNESRRWLDIQAEILTDLDRRVGSRSAYHLLSLYWYHDQVRRKGAELLNVDMKRRQDLWIGLMEDAQEKMKREVERRELIIEVNPSSNRLVGPMASFDEHHIFNMTLDADGELDRRLRVTVNTDDPGVFNTSLPHEYYLLGEILIERGVAEPKVEEWLEWLRKNGEDSSFVRSLPHGDDPRVEKLLRSVQHGRSPISEPVSVRSMLRRHWSRLAEGHRRLHRPDLPERIEELERRLDER